MCVVPRRTEKKAETLRAKQQAEMEEKHQQEVDHAEQAKVRSCNAQNAFEAWKKKKEESALEAEQLHSSAEPLHERAWCPARSITHSYPSSEKTSKKVQSSRPSPHSPSQTSRVSQSHNSSHSQSNQSTTSSPSRSLRAASSPAQSPKNHSIAMMIQMIKS